MPPNALTNMPVVDTSRCTGCGRCVAACSNRLFTLEVSGFRKHALLHNRERCAGCLNCVAACPVGAVVPAASTALPPVR